MFIISHQGIKIEFKANRYTCKEGNFVKNCFVALLMGVYSKKEKISEKQSLPSLIGPLFEGAWFAAKITWSYRIFKKMAENEPNIPIPLKKKLNCTWVHVCEILHSFYTYGGYKLLPDLMRLSQSKQLVCSFWVWFTKLWGRILLRINYANMVDEDSLFVSTILT